MVVSTVVRVVDADMVGVAAKGWGDGDGVHVQLGDTLRVSGRSREVRRLLQLALAAVERVEAERRCAIRHYSGLASEAARDARPPLVGPGGIGDDEGDAAWVAYTEARA